MCDNYTFLHLTPLSNPVPLSSRPCIASMIPLHILIPLLTKESLSVIAINLNLSCISLRDRRDEYVRYLLGNLPTTVSDQASVFSEYIMPTKRARSHDATEDDGSTGGRLRALWATPRGSGRGRAHERTWLRAMQRQRFAREGPCGHPAGSRNIDEISG